MMNVMSTTDGGRLLSDTPGKVEAGTPVKGQVANGGDPFVALWVRSATNPGNGLVVDSSNAADVPVPVVHLPNLGRFY